MIFFIPEHLHASFVVSLVDLPLKLDLGAVCQLTESKDLRVPMFHVSPSQML